MSVPTFVVGTGRCGSTMLSNMLRDHPKVLSLSEFFTAFVAARGFEILGPDPIDGKGFRALLAGRIPLFEFMLKHGLEVPEELYRPNSSRFSLATGIPAILHTALPHLTDDSDRLFDAIWNEVEAWPRAPLGEHCRHLFAWLANRLGKQFWIERSGGSLLYLSQLLMHFPDARFVHLVRDGRDTALSIREHLGYRLFFVFSRVEQVLGAHPLNLPNRDRIDDVPDALRPFLPEQFDVAAFLDHRESLTDSGAYWAWEIVEGLRLLAAVPEHRVLTVRYEDLFADRDVAFRALAAFLGDDLVDDPWAGRCAASLHAPRSTWRDLPEVDARALTEACWPGFEQLEAAGVRYDFRSSRTSSALQ